MSRPIIIALSCGALACGGAFVAGCGGDDNKDSATTLPVGSTPATTGAPAKAGAVTVVMQNNLFSPEKITVKVGQQIHWTNNDSYPHNVTATTKGAGLQSKNINGGGTFDFTAKKPGTINYICTIHSGQKGSIRVTR